MVNLFKTCYQAGINKFVNFCAMYNSSNPLPLCLSQFCVCLYITHLANLGLASGTIRTYIVAIRYILEGSTCHKSMQLSLYSYLWECGQVFHSIHKSISIFIDAFTKSNYKKRNQRGSQLCTASQYYDQYIYVFSRRPSNETNMKRLRKCLL